MPVSAHLVDALREDLTSAHYTVDVVDELLGPIASRALGREQPLPARRALASRTERAAVLARGFLLGEPLTRRDLDGALPGCRTDGAVALGLVEASGNGPDDVVRAALDLRPYAATDAAGTSDWWVASDLGGLATDGALRTDHVLGIGGASTTLAQATIRPHVGRTLDLGTGCGVQALHASRHSARVTATDISTRALRIAALNLALAGVADRVDLRHGDMLEPVAGERFDLVVSNPPFVVTPRRPGVPAYEYRDAGLVGDEVVRRLVTGVGSVLAPGGTAQLLGCWEVRRGQTWADRLEAWLESAREEQAARGDGALDAWVVQRELQDPAEYAETWIRDGHEPPGARFDELYGAWLDDFAARDVEAIGFGLITLRRPAADSAGATAHGWTRLEEQYGPVRQPLGSHLQRCLEARDLLATIDALDAGGASHDQAGLLDSRWVVAPDVTEERHLRPGDADPAAILLRQTEGFGRTVRVGTKAAAVVGACDGELTLGQITAAVAVLLGEAEGEVRARVLGVVRDLIGDALLLPA
ncbi:MAG TPA: class I SAM-dependent methyltransferase [Actinomycetales bacterium]|nr:class I SAM-dependent methyltransferase [Actinomycetales bacterium]